MEDPPEVTHNKKKTCQPGENGWGGGRGGAGRWSGPVEGGWSWSRGNITAGQRLSDQSLGRRQLGGRGERAGGSNRGGEDRWRVGGSGFAGILPEDGG